VLDVRNDVTPHRRRPRLMFLDDDEIAK
jgi:hypothetical protein